jgi:hypothetical protein
MRVDAGVIEMTTKEALLEKIDQLDERQTLRLLVLVDEMLNDEDVLALINADVDAQYEALRGLIGIMGPGEPSNIAEHKDEYIADAIQDWN